MSAIDSGNGKWDHAMSVQSAVLLGGILVILLVAAVIIYARSRLRGSIIFTSVDRETKVIPLPNRPWLTLSTVDILGVVGKVTVRGDIFNSKVHVTVKLREYAKIGCPLQPDGRAMIAGFDVRHITKPALPNS